MSKRNVKEVKEKLVLNVAELAAELGISKPTAYELIKREGFPAVKVSERRTIIPVEALKLWLVENSGLRG